MSFGTLDPAELQCCGQQMQPQPQGMAFVCPVCQWGVTKIEFLRSAHLWNVREAIKTRHFGRQF